MDVKRKTDLENVFQRVLNCLDVNQCYILLILVTLKLCTVKPIRSNCIYRRAFLQCCDEWFL